MMRFQSLENAFFLALLLLVTAAFLGVVQDFLQPVFWAALLASLFHRLYVRWLPALGGRESLTAALTLLFILLIVILPLILVGLAVTHESALFYQRITSGEIDIQKPIRYVEQTLPAARDFLERLGVDAQRLKDGLSSAAVTSSRFLASQAVNIGQNALRLTVMFFVMLYLLFFFLRDGSRLVEALIHVLPIGDERERRLFAKFAEVSRATLKGTLVVGLVQGVLGGLLFWAVGIEAAVFWAVVMTVLSVLPAVGAGLVWAPAALWMFAAGEPVKGLVIVGFGALVIGLVDNLLRPLLVGRDTKMPDYLILISTLGGLAVLGISGFVIGPIIAALFLVAWEMFVEEFGGHAPTALPDGEESAGDADGGAEKAVAETR